MIATLFTQSQSDTEILTEHFNLDYLEDNLDHDMLENIADTSDDRTVYTRDILSDAVSHIINDNETEVHNENPKKVMKGGKRGRKFGYRSENSNKENTLCGVCGAKVNEWVNRNIYGLDHYYAEFFNAECPKMN